MDSDPVLTTKDTVENEASTDALYRHTATVHGGTAVGLVQNLIDESFRLLVRVCSIYSHVCFYHRLSSLLVVPTNITVTSPGQIDLGNAGLQGLPADTLGGDPSGKLFDWITSAFFFSYVRPLASLLLIHRVLTRIDTDFPRFSIKYLLALFPKFILHGSGLLELPSVGEWFQPSW